MRIGVAWQDVQNANYRAADPMQAMERLGHEVVWPDRTGTPDPRALRTCDVVHVYRRAEQHDFFAEVVRAGVPMVFDNDDDSSTHPKESPEYRNRRGLRGEAAFAASVRMARLAHTCTTTSDVLAEKYRRAGVPRVATIPNYPSPQLERPRSRHRGLLIGWVAALEHRADVRRLGIGDALQRVLDAHPHVRVECVGVDLQLTGDRYRHREWVPFAELPRWIGGLDIGIAPLADIPFNAARSDIKVKEYAASGVPWLASPVGPYRGLGEDQGGRLVPDTGWFDALDDLVTGNRTRKRLARRASRWARTQTIDAASGDWERVFRDAARSAP